jgi:GNAT superfamily N-acetyltransferase
MTSPAAPRTEARDGFEISTDPARLDLDLIHRYLSAESYWARGIAREVVERACVHSLCFGLYTAGQQAGFARVVTDYATYAYLNDVFVLEAYRGRGLGAWLMETVVAHPALQGLLRFSLATRDAQGFYERFGWQALRYPERHMERLAPGYYNSGSM